MQNIKGAIFDLDGTLVNSLVVWEVIDQKLARKYLNKDTLDLAPEDHKSMYTMLLKDCMKMFHEKYNMGSSTQELIDDVNSMVYHFYKDEVQLKDGVKEFLDHLYNNGVKMCIASATDTALLNLAVEHCGLNKYFSRIFSCSEFNKGKEHPDVFLAALDFLGTRKEDTFVFEDSLTAVKTCKQAGFRVVGIYDKYNMGFDEIKALADYSVDDGETLMKLI